MAAIRVLKKQIYSIASVTNSASVTTMRYGHHFLLGHHLDLAKQMPEQIDKLISQSLAKYASSLDSARRLAEIDLAATKARDRTNCEPSCRKSAQREIARAAQTVAQITVRKSWLQWLGGAAVVGMLLMGGTFYWDTTSGIQVDMPVRSM